MLHRSTVHAEALRQTKNHQAVLLEAVGRLLISDIIPLLTYALSVSKRRNAGFRVSPK